MNFTNPTDALLFFAASLRDKKELGINSLVQWKEGLQNKPTSTPMIVLEHLEHPLIPNYMDSSKTDYQEKLDIRVGFLSFVDESRSTVVMVESFLDSRRLTDFVPAPFIPQAPAPAEVDKATGDGEPVNTADLDEQINEKAQADDFAHHGDTAIEDDTAP